MRARALAATLAVIFGLMITLCPKPAFAGIAVVQTASCTSACTSTLAFTTQNPTNGNVVCALVSDNRTLSAALGIQDSNGVQLTAGGSVITPATDFTNGQAFCYTVSGSPSETYTWLISTGASYPSASALIEISGLGTQPVYQSTGAGQVSSAQSITSPTIPALASGSISLIVMGLYGGTPSSSTVNGNAATSLISGVGYYASYYINNAAFASPFSATFNTSNNPTAMAILLVTISPVGGNAQICYPDPGSMTYFGGNWLAFESRFYEKVLVARAIRTLGDRTLARSGTR